MRALRTLAATVAVLLLVVGCGATDPGGAVPGHVPVSLAPSTVGGSPSPAPAVTAQGVATTPIEAVDFGMHVQRIGSWPQIPIGSFRIWNADSTWGALEPSPGAWSFASLDTRVDLAEESGAPALLVLGMPPAWAATQPGLRSYGGSPSPPTDISAWRTYVRTVAERYAGRIEAYEVWNEPNLTQFWVGSPTEMTELTVVAAEEIRAVDPAALIVSSGLSGRTAGGPQWFSAYAAGLGDAVDVVGLHVYPYPGDGPESMVAMVADYRSRADDVGLAGLPIWNTEIGYGRAPAQLFSGDAAAALILRTYLVLPAVGVSRNYWYMWDDREFIGLYMVEPDRVTPTESAEAFVAAQRWLVGSALLGCTDAGGGAWTCELVKDGVVAQVKWNVGGEAAVTAPEGTTIMYPFRGAPQAIEAGASVPVGDLPVLFAPTEIPGLVG